jgi:HAE1 family hydrophobic/amphiphilic exporter-1
MSNFLIRRPIVAIVIAILTVIVGVVAMLTLPTSQYPDIVPPEIMVQATYPGADAKTLAQAVATPVEQQMNGVDNMLYMSSVSANNGQATLYVDFDVKTNADTDQVLSQLRVAQAQADTDIEQTKLRQQYMPIFRKVLPGKKAATFFQLDRRISTMIDLQLTSQLPLAQSQD